MADFQLAEARELELTPMDDPAHWVGNDLTDRSGWRHDLTDGEVNELVSQSSRLLDESASIQEVTPKDFDLPVLAPTLTRLSNELRDGLGFVVIRGLPTEEMSVDATTMAFWIVSLHLGEPMRQPGDTKLAHVKFVPENRGQFGYMGNIELPYHSDLEDIIGFLCIRPAESGGDRKIASSVAIHNEMVRRRPDLASVLYRPIHMAIQRPHPDHGKPWTELPMFSVVDGKLCVAGYRVHMKRALRFPGVPRPTAEQSEALKLFNALAEEMRYQFQVSAGDIEFYNNHTSLHTRTDFIDEREHGKNRHLLRIWLSQPGLRPLPPEHPIELRKRGGSAEAEGQQS